MAGGMVMVILAVWLFVRTWWGHLPHTIVNAVTGPSS